MANWVNTSVGFHAQVWTTRSPGQTQWGSYRYLFILILDMKLAFKTYQKNLKRTSFATFTPPLFSVRKKEEFFFAVI